MKQIPICAGSNQMGNSMLKQKLDSLCYRKHTHPTISICLNTLHFNRVQIYWKINGNEITI